VNAVILAGGEGRRLLPVTLAMPKPLIPLDGTPILEIILLQLRDAGFSHVTLSLGYRAEMIQDWFGDGRRLGLRLDYSTELQPLGTAGPLSLLRRFDGSTLVMNADVLTDLDFADLWAWHRTTGAAATIALRTYELDLPYGVVEIDERNRVVSYQEKPCLRVTINCGIYMLEPMVLGYLPDGAPCDMPSLLEAVRADGGRVEGYCFDGEWIDIGTPAALSRATEALRAERARYLRNGTRLPRSGVIGP